MTVLVSPTRLDQVLSPRSACKVIVGLLELAGNYGVEAELAQQIEVLLELGELPDLEALFAQFAPRQARTISADDLWLLIR